MSDMAVTTFISRIDPTGEHHRALGHQCADMLFKSCPLGDPDEEMINLVQLRAEAVITSALTPIGASIDQIRAAILETADHFGARYLELCAEFAAKGGRA